MENKMEKKFYCTHCQRVFELPIGKTINAHGAFRTISYLDVKETEKDVCPGKIKPFEDWKKE